MKAEQALRRTSPQRRAYRRNIPRHPRRTHGLSGLRCHGPLDALDRRGMIDRQRRHQGTGTQRRFGIGA